MKFGKEFTAQMVPEWHEAYMDYNHLKKILKDILIFKEKHSESITVVDHSHSSLKRKIHLYRAFSGLTTWNRNSLTRRTDEEAAVLFAAADGEADAHVPAFFAGVETQLRKVARFYSGKVEEVVAEADELSRQMDVLIALRVKIENPEASIGKLNIPDGAKVELEHMDAIREVEMNSNGVVRDEEDDDDDDEEQGINEVREASDQSGNSSPNEVVGGPMISPIVILDSVKINKGHETPLSKLKRRMIKAYTSSEFNKDQLRQSEELMAKAFVEFYQKLRLLKSYRFMNRMAFSKIMKKYDKITKRSASKTILDMVDETDLGSCEKLNHLMERVEAAFIKHFWNGDREKGMHILRPKKRREKHTITFFLGCLFGCSIALVVTIAVLVHVRGIVDSKGGSTYMENIFPLYSLFGYIILHMVLFGGNIYFWRRYRINYPFIFGLKEGTVLEYREVFLLSAGLSVLSLAAVISNLNMDMDRKLNHFETLPELVPLILVSVILVILFCPLNIIYRSTRKFLLTSTLHILLAPLYKVTLPDFFLADQLTSQFQALRSLEFYVCYYIRGNFRLRDSRKCLDNTVYEAFYIIAAAFPFWIRFLQCVRRLAGERDKMHTYNALKYFSIIVAVCTRTLYEQKKGTLLLVIAATTSVGATTFATWWDIALDWGLLQRKSRNPWLRDKLVVRSKLVYFAAIVLNCVLRFAWMQAVLGFTETPFLHKNAFVAIFASLEVIRRGVWNFFRLENEHLNNVGKYRAFKSVPLPFNYENGDKDN